MLKVEPLSMEWFNTPALRLQAATGVSRSAASEADLMDLVRRGLDGKLSGPDQTTEVFRRQIMGDLFTAVDGASSVRVIDAILGTIGAARSGKSNAVALPRPSARGLVAETARRTLGYKASAALRRRYGSPENERRRLGKAFAPDLVNSVLGRVSAAAGDGRNFVARQVMGNSRRTSKAMSGASMQLTETN
jgi:hypothetical protein